MVRPVALKRYTIVAICLHWLIALAILALIGIGLYMTKAGLKPAQQFPFYQIHKSIGITVLMLSVLRLIWRLFFRPPPMADMPRPERLLAEGAHGLFYILIIGLPLSGWAMVSASRYNIPTVLYGVIRWPHMSFLSSLPQAEKAQAEASLKLVHAYGAYLLIALLILHAGAALRHHFVLRDETLWRMLPFVRRPSRLRS